MADDARLELRIKSPLLTELREAAGELGGTYTVSRLATDLVENFLAERRLRSQDRAMLANLSRSAKRE